ncbi:MAG: SOS response-associated peptidase [Rhodobacteraceae bacterium]|nr:SOS response-associated peptidase [Paracoccaceae bacterium]
MPGRLFLETPVAEVAAALGTPVGAVADEPPRRNIAPGQEVLVLRDDGALVRMRWGLIPVGRVNARGRPVMETLINARSETLFDKSAFEGLRRCIVPADGWYEWTGKARRKTAWRIKPKSGGLLAFAAVWDVWNGPGGIQVAQVATVTCEPSADVRDIHHRMGVLRHPADYSVWLNGAQADAAALCVPYPDGALGVAAASDVDWGAA